jgi:hypothetical protein
LETYILSDCFLLFPMATIGLFRHHAFSHLPIEIWFLFWLCHNSWQCIIFISGVLDILIGAPWYVVKLLTVTVSTYVNQLSPLCAGALPTSHDLFQVWTVPSLFIHFTFLVTTSSQYLPFCFSSPISFWCCFNYDTNM